MLGSTRPFCDLAQAFGRLDAKLRGAVEDFLAALAELADDRLGHPRYLEGAMLTLEINPVTEPIEACTKIGMIDRADDTVVAPQLAPMEGLPFAVGHQGQIGHEG